MAGGWDGAVKAEDVGGVCVILVFFREGLCSHLECEAAR